MPTYECRGKKKLWSAVICEGYKRKRLSGYKTKKEAQQAVAEYLANHKSDPAEITFDQIAEEYVEAARHRVKETSLADIQAKLRQKILPSFSGIQVKKIDSMAVLAWQNSTDGLSYAYRRGLRTLLSSIFLFAERYHGIPSPMKNVDPLRKPIDTKDEPFHVWEPDEFYRFLSCVHDQTAADCFELMFFSGVRRGEALGLQWDCVAEDSIRIKRNRVTHAKEKMSTPKTQSAVRTISMPKQLLDKIREHRKDGQFVFGGKDSIAPTTLDRRFKSAILESGVTPIRIHDLRHSHASMLISNGVSIVAVSKRLGHTNTQMTLNVYSHMMPSDDKLIGGICERFVK